MSPNAMTGYGFLEFSQQCTDGGPNCVDDSGCLDCFNDAVTSATNVLNRPVCSTAIPIQTVATAVPVITDTVTTVPVVVIPVTATTVPVVVIPVTTVPVIATTEVPIATTTVPVIVTTEVPVATVTVPVAVTTEVPVVTTVPVVVTVPVATVAVPETLVFETSQPSIFTQQAVTTFFVTSPSEGTSIAPAALIPPSRLVSSPARRDSVPG